MKEKLKKLVKSKKFIVIASSAVVLTGIVCYFSLSDKGTAVSLTKAKTGTVEQYFETNAVIESGSQSKFQIIEGTKVTAVNVVLGANVKKGDILATFDTSGLNAVLSEKKQAYDDALKRYNDTVTQSKNAKKQLKELDQQIDSIDAQIAVLQAKSSTDTTTSSTTAASLTPDELRAILKASNASGQTSFTDEEIEQMVNALGSGGSSDLQNALSSVSQADTQISSLQTQKSLLETQKSMLENQDYSTLESTYQSLVTSTKADYDETKAIVDTLKNGWTAEFDGVVTQINIKAGQTYEYAASGASSNASILDTLTNALSNGAGSDDLNAIISQSTSSQGVGVGMVVDNYNDYFASFSLGKYDALNVKLDQNAIITSVAGKYKGYVSYISPTATSTSSALSSLTGTDSSTTTLKAKATVLNPDDALIIGFDVKLAVKIAEAENVITIPIEAIQIDSEKRYVYVYDKTTKTVHKKAVSLGISSDTAYEVKSGLKVGDVIVKNPSKDLTDGAKVYDEGAAQ